MRIAIFGRKFEEENLPFIENLFEILKRRGIDYILHEEYKKQIGRFINVSSSETFREGEILNGLDFMFSVGGDGTILESVTYIRHHETPILGINTGRLGFLATTSHDAIEQVLEDLDKGLFTIDSRMMIRLESESGLFGELNFALNDFGIHKSDTSSMITIHTFVNGEFLNSYWADGLLITTPTGSTGYSLSCGGPIIFPRSGNILITPISPHNLTVRPIVVADTAVISFDIESRSDSFLISLDSRSQVVSTGIQLAVRKENFGAKLVRMNDENFLFTLRTKLNWGLDVRN